MASEQFDFATREKLLMEKNEELERQRKKVVEEAERLMNAQEKLFEETTSETFFQTSFDSDTEEDAEEKESHSDKEHPIALEENFEKTTLADIELETKVLGADQLNDSSAARFFKARCKKLEEDITILAKKCSISTSDLADAKASFKKKSNDFDQLQKRFTSMQNQNTRLKEKLSEQKKSGSLLKDEIKTLERQLRTDKRNQKKSRSESQTHDIRLNRALAEVKKYKDLALKHQNENVNYLSANQQKIGKLQGEIQSLKRQKRDLLTAHKKQLKLIDVLKRQKLHLEAVKILSFTEEDFIRTLELGQKLHSEV